MKDSQVLGCSRVPKRNTFSRKLYLCFERPLNPASGTFDLILSSVRSPYCIHSDNYWSMGLRNPMSVLEVYSPAPASDKYGMTTSAYLEQFWRAAIVHAFHSRAESGSSAVKPNWRRCKFQSSGSSPLS